MTRTRSSIQATDLTPSQATPTSSQSIRKRRRSSSKSEDPSGFRVRIRKASAPSPEISPRASKRLRTNVTEKVSVGDAEDDDTTPYGTPRGTEKESSPPPSISGNIDEGEPRV